MPPALSGLIFRKRYEPTKYDNVYLSKIIRMFLSIGFEHVNIIDGSCRTISRDDVSLPSQIQSLTRQHSDEEVENYEEWEKEASNMGTGNKRQRRRTKKERTKKGSKKRERRERKEKGTRRK
jgi:hypothetical protein